MAQVRLEGVYKMFGEVVAVEDANLTIEDEEFVVLVGPSGCGKSTTLRMIAGLEEISEGDLYIGDRRVNDVPPKDRDIAMVFQSYALYPHMTVRENMAFGLRLRRMKKDLVEEMVQRAAKTLGLSELLDRKPKELSGGQRQRVAMGRAIVRKPAVFLFDEPLSNLDAKLRVQMRAEIAKLHRKLGSTSVYVTHDQVEAMTLADRIVVMKDGVIQQTGPPMELYRRPANTFVATFIGSPAMNLFHGKLAEDAGSLAVKGEGFEFTLPPALRAAIDADPTVGSELVLGVRPQDLRVCGVEEGHVPEAVLEFAEPLGMESYLYLGVPGGQTVVRDESGEAPEVGARLSLAFREESVHLFDKSDGHAIR